MKIGINASFLRKQGTGIGQVSFNCIRQMVQNADPKKYKFILYLEEDVDLGLPKNFSKKILRPRFYKRDDIVRAIYWQKFMLPRQAKKDGCELFLSLYQSATVMPKKIRHIMIVHDIILDLFPSYIDNWRKKFFWKITKKAIRRADKIISVSKRTEKDLIQRLDMDPATISTVYIAVDEIFQKEVSGEKSDKVLKKYGLKKGYIYSGGGMEMRKNIEGTIRAYKILLDNNRDRFAKIKPEKIPPLVLSGKLMPELAPLVTDAEGLINSMDLGKRVKLLGFVPQEDLPALYKNALFFSFPSFYEGFGLPVLEAMSQGVPVLTSKKSSLPEVGRDAVLYCDPDDIEDVVTVMKNLLTRDDLRAAISEKAIKRSQFFSWQKFADKLLNIFDEEFNVRKRRKKVIKKRKTIMNMAIKKT